MHFINEANRKEQPIGIKNQCHHGFKTQLKLNRIARHIKVLAMTNTIFLWVQTGKKIMELCYQHL